MIVLESIDEKPFKITRFTPDVLKVVPAEAANRHEVVVDWDKWWNSAENAKLTFYFEGHDRCNQFFTVVDLNREQRAEIQRRIREKRQSNGDKKSQKQAKKGETNVPAAPTSPWCPRLSGRAVMQNSRGPAEQNADIDERIRRVSSPRHRRQSNSGRRRILEPVRRSMRPTISSELRHAWRNLEESEDPDDAPREWREREYS